MNEERKNADSRLPIQMHVFDIDRLDAFDVRFMQRIWER